MSKNRFDSMFAEADAAFDGLYKNELNELVGLSKEEVDSVTSGTTDLRVYAALVKVVEKASIDNESQAQLVENIKALGDLGIKIARKVPRLRALL